ncbi:methylmalonyl Co-A mutase-associated GTPase MeaB [soil metagenome]
MSDVESLAEGVLGGDRRALARAITLVESTRADHRAEAAELLDALLPHTGSAIRLGVSGAPGVGKSTFLEAFGTHLTGAGHRVAVLAVDPSSSRSGGSILGDKTRMPALANDAAAFIRPSPAGGSTGGVARRTREALLCCEAAGFDVVCVETVGVGQAELAVADLVDLFVLLVGPGGGDDLQGIKRGVMELADLVVITKADGGLLPDARRAAADHRAALGLLRRPHPQLEPQVLLTSATNADGIAAVWEAVEAADAILRVDGALDHLRAERATAWLRAEISAQVLDDLRADPATRALLEQAEADVAAGRASVVAVAARVLDAVRPPS